MDTLPPAAIVDWFKYLYAFEFLYTLGMATVKYSVLCFMHRIFPVVQFRRLLKLGLCVPIHKFWETLGGELAPQLGGRCINVRHYFLISGAINTFTDFALLALPIPILWRLRTGKPQKWLLTAIFTVGLIVCVVSVVRLVVLSRVDQSDITWNYVPAAVWSSAEPSVAVVSACLPSLRPLFVRIVWGGSHRPGPKPIQSTTHRSRSMPSWRHNDSKNGNEGSFNRLQEMSSGDGGPRSPWRTNSVTVFGGKGKGGGDGDEEIELTGGEEGEVPLGRIRAKTEVVLTISERVDWRDDLF
ncbi:MAG: hypothetical protein LQ350_000862 [Teloschistes chrysophthalmus]|nr:MAG: hypothetical protein LQ350_000862 [Niorma chrysophthalma]